MECDAKEQKLYQAENYYCGLKLCERLYYFVP